MPTIMAHAAVAWGLARAARRPGDDEGLSRGRERMCALVAMLPDLDVIAFRLGIAYEAPLGHRGLSHSLAGAVVIALIAFALLRRATQDPIGSSAARAEAGRGQPAGSPTPFSVSGPRPAAGSASTNVVKRPRARPRDFALLVLAAASHGLLDTLTDGGLGVGLLLPFHDERYFAPVTPIPVSPIGLLHFLASGWPVLAWEMLLLGPVALAGAIVSAPAPMRQRALGVGLVLAVAAAAWSARLAA